MSAVIYDGWARRAERRRECQRRVVAQYRANPALTCEQIARPLGVSANHVSALLREAGIRQGTGNKTTRRGKRPSGAAYHEVAERLNRAEAVALGMWPLKWGELKRISLEFGVCDSSLAMRLKRRRAAVEVAA